MELKTLTVQDFVTAAASEAPTPGGGAVAAVTAATGAALAEMVANLTIGKKGYEDVKDVMVDLQQRAQVIRERSLELAQADADAFGLFMNALALPKETDEEKAIRKEALQNAYKSAGSVPFEIGELANQIFDLADIAVQQGNTNLVTDGAIAAINARAAVRAAFLNVRINLMGIKDEAFNKEMREKMEAIESQIDAREQAIVNACNL
ncbi:cyclodeaminase/cyclohydrolase family protein [Veillonella sp. YH-vei2232]|jgi:formiminotetrahydrofolate cyclodeaminase|uniref:Cyclodeaminase/cyclohydrolase family protein n=1 Tax=Veillonella absiana TaxID=3079305 RepID=A0ABU3Z9E4_9FIRM|nr:MULTISPECIES: cyclodeaminase/cyclohydrolase family protein [unclassified Veillonella]NCB95257.1 methenyltetrahydrofolate cyclohydrolase [Negativicutes bacterium]MBP6923074.1 cyclodeaminase/cyclohydrolase family protein [Veillonella sp.]MBP9516555.1 cyclodeaminase/cyclohydrolase family protein [Veillonella sp.]MBP9550549.1 cyclodeaminase/cyclohydrolase family protein [Veillonella sp.]MDV5063078.1 cyclodeaminase/cyclohydrolase family protein [Veillonella sp. YH-vei2232]